MIRFQTENVTRCRREEANETDPFHDVDNFRLSSLDPHDFFTRFVQWHRDNYMIISAEAGVLAALVINGLKYTSF